LTKVRFRSKSLTLATEGYMRPTTKEQIRVRPMTRRHLERIRRVKGWTFAEAVERAVRKLLSTDPELDGPKPRDEAIAA
jgi:hypothetical protein